MLTQFLVLYSVLAGKNLGDVAYDNFLDHTDHKTTIRQYLTSAGSGIMEEEPCVLFTVWVGVGIRNMMEMIGKGGPEDWNWIFTRRHLWLFAKRLT